MKTIRLTNKHTEFFKNSIESFAKKEHKFIFAGHTHKEIIGKHYFVCDSLGEHNKYYNLNDDIFIFSDMHMPNIFNNKNFDTFKKFHKKIKKYVIFNGDTFDLSLSSNKEILEYKEFWKILEYLYKKNITIIFIIGNHDYNLIKKNNDIRKMILSICPNAIISRNFTIKNTMFIHGDEFDLNVHIFKKWYIRAFVICDYIGRPARWIWNNIFKKIFDKFFEIVDTIVGVKE